MRLEEPCARYVHAMQLLMLASVGTAGMLSCAGARRHRCMQLRMHDTWERTAGLAKSVAMEPPAMAALKCPQAAATQ